MLSTYENKCSGVNFVLDYIIQCKAILLKEDFKLL